MNVVACCLVLLPGGVARGPAAPQPGAHRQVGPGDHQQWRQVLLVSSQYNSVHPVIVNQSCQTRVTRVTVAPSRTAGLLLLCLPVRRSRLLGRRGRGGCPPRPGRPRDRRGTGPPAPPRRRQTEGRPAGPSPPTPPPGSATLFASYTTVGLPWSLQFNQFKILPARLHLPD